MLKLWNLPQAITDAVRDHHVDPSNTQCGGGGILLGLAEQLSDLWQVGRGKELDLGKDAPVERYLPALERIGLVPEAWDSLVWDVRHELTNIEELYHQTI